MTKQEAFDFLNKLKNVFDIVRLVNVNLAIQYAFNKDGELVEKPYECYAVWNKDRRCENCISVKALSNKCRTTKYEFVDNEVFHVISMYVEVDGLPYALEMVNKTDDETLFGAYGKDVFSKTITAYTKKLYTDSLTGAFNRTYYEEQVKALKNVHAAAIFDCDDFKAINDTYGHNAGDLALKTIVNAAFSSVRSTDTLVRFGGDEFIIIFNDIPKEIFKEKLHLIKDKVSASSIEEYPQIKLSVSIGGVYSSEGIEDILREADEMLYKAKEEKNRVCVKVI